MPIITITYASRDRTLFCHIDFVETGKWFVTFHAGQGQKALAHTVRNSLASAQGVAGYFCGTGNLPVKDPNITIYK